MLLRKNIGTLNEKIHLGAGRSRTTQPSYKPHNVDLPLEAQWEQFAEHIHVFSADDRVERIMLFLILFLTHLLSLFPFISPQAHSSSTGLIHLSTAASHRPHCSLTS